MTDHDEPAIAEGGDPPPGRRPAGGRAGRAIRLALTLAGWAAGIALFSWLHRLAGTDAAGALANAQALQSVEHALGVDIEGAANHWLARSPGLASAAVWFYRLYYLPLAGVLLWLLLRHRESYRTVRTTMIVMAVVALLVFWAMPTSPPRFALPGIVDLVALHDPIAGAASRDFANGQNHFSAFPSLHVGWSAVCAFAAHLALRARSSRRSSRWALLVWGYPAIMVAVVIGTGNHYVLDVAGSAALVGLSIAAATAWQRYADRHHPRRGGWATPATR